MSTERDTTRIVRSWLAEGSTAIPDRVLDAVLLELPSRPQRRSRWSSWRSSRVHTSVRVIATAAAIVVAVALGSRLLGEPNVGNQASEIRGQLVFLLGGSNEVTIDVQATATGRSLAGTATIVYEPGDIAIDLECSRIYDATTWLLAGEIVEATPGTQPVGTRTAIIVRAGDPQRVTLWFEDSPPAADCRAFVAGIPDDAVELYLNPVERSSLELPSGG